MIRKVIGLSPIERKILSRIQFSSHLSIREFAKINNVSERSVRYTVEKFEKKGILQRTVCLDLYSIGHSSALIYFSTPRLIKKDQDDLIKFLSTRSNVTWLAELGGDYQYGMAVTVRSPNDLQVFLLSISKRYLSLFREKTVVFQTGYAMYPRKYFTTEVSGDEEIYCSALNAKKVIIDEWDAKIIGALCDSPSASLRQLADKVGKSHSAIEHRVASLRSKGVILGDYYQVDGSRFGYETYKLFISTKAISPLFSNSLRQFCSKNRSIIYLIECVGTWDYEVGVDALAPQHVVPVVQDLYEAFPDFISNIRTVPVFRPIKFQFYTNY